MNKILRNVLIGLAIVIVLVSVGGNLYSYGYKQLEANLMQKGFNIAVGQIANTVKQTGQVQLSQDLILVPKVNATPDIKK